MFRVQLHTDRQMGAPICLATGHMVSKKRIDLPNRSSERTWHPDLSAGMQAGSPAEDGGRWVKGMYHSGPRQLGCGAPGEPGEHAHSLLLFSRIDQPPQLGEDRGDNSRGAPREPQSRQCGPLTWPSIAATALNLRRPAGVGIRIKFVPPQSCWGTRL